MTPDLLRLLDELRGRIRRYVVIEGVAALLVLLCGSFWLSYWADVLHFSFSKLELPGWFRLGWTLSTISALVLGGMTWIGFRLFRSFRRKSLALVLERRFPELGDRLITAVEFSESPTQEINSPLGQAMLNKTIEEARRLCAQLDLSRVFDSRPLRRAVTTAAVLLASVIGFGAMNAQAMERWWSAFIMGRDDYWEPYRKSAMLVKILAPPGERVREFDSNQTYKHPRGADLTVLAESTGKTPPDRTLLKYYSFGGNSMTRGQAPMSRRGERQFQHTLSRVIDPQELWVMGGDYVNRTPFRIQIVDPPRIDRIDLHCKFPDYIGEEQRTIPVLGVQASLPLETVFVLWNPVCL